MTPGYTALRESAAWLDRSLRGRIRVTGDDRARLLHAMASNHIEQLQPGQGCYTFFLNAQGRILADARVLCFAESFLLDTEPETLRTLYEHLDKHIIADDVSLEDITAQTAELSIEGPRATDVLRALSAPLPPAPWNHLPWNDRTVVKSHGFTILAPAAAKDALMAALESAGAVSATSDDDRIVRLEQARPRYGEDISEKHLIHETQIFDGVHFNKGCYLGQEIVERVRSRGGVHRFLVGLTIEGSRPPAPGTRIAAGDREVGEITSAAYSPALGAIAALGYVRTGDIPKDALLQVDGQRAAISSMKPSPPAAS